MNGQVEVVEYDQVFNLTKLAYDNFISQQLEEKLDTSLSMNHLLFSSTVVPLIPKKSKNFSSLLVYFCLVIGDFNAYEYSDQIS
jgi:hypothetical protein